MAGTRVRIDTNSQPNKKKFGNKSFVGNDDDDRISQLPDDILVSILSLLSLREAGRTSLLSSRWINLWKNTPSLDFDDGSDFDLICWVPQKNPEWVNSVIQSHKSPVLKLFRIGFPLYGSATNPITWWLQFACCRQVQRLALDFRILCEYNRLPEELSAPRSSMLFDFKYLKELSLKYVSVSGGDIEYFLHNCPLLEKLIVRCPGKIPKLEVCGSSLVLKHLEILYCRDLESLKISAPTLTSLRVTSLEGLLLENVPMLVDLSVAFENDTDSVRCLLYVLSCCVSQLESLNLVLRRSYDRRETDELCLPANLPEMPKLKNLVVEYGLSGRDGSLIRLASFIKASPYLHEFVLKNIWFDSTIRADDAEAYTHADHITRFPHENLKMFKFCGYYGRPCDDGLVRCILENCVALEKIIIAPSSEYCRDRLRVDKAAREHAKQHLQPLFPHHVEFVIL